MSPAIERMLLNMVLQTKYEAKQERVPSVPEIKERIYLIRRKLLPVNTIKNLCTKLRIKLNAKGKTLKHNQFWVGSESREIKKIEQSQK